MKKIIIILFTCLLCISCSMNNDVNITVGSTTTEKIKNEKPVPSEETVEDVSDVGVISDVEDGSEEETSATEEVSGTGDVGDVNTPTEESTTQKEIDWDKTISKINNLLFELGCTVYNDRFFKDRKKFIHPEIECSIYYPKIEGLEYTTTTIDRPDGNGCNYWYYHYELSHTTENIERIAKFLGKNQEELIVWEK
ncbi:hypothetical protein [Treponema sp. C6A8]|uniref:hypothetical protein n=1 Tax=Treponema sp. C6A8 TaxID=1410609 RepID=UPI000484E270|nr:hypothetical protein [Treponema sp. C6A8]